MKSDEFWSVDLGVRMGPFVLGKEREPLFDLVREHGIDVERLRRDQSGRILLPEVGCELSFSHEAPRALVRINVRDERLRFGSLSVIGKRAHEIVGLFKVPRKETLWTSLEVGDENSDLVAKHYTDERARQLLADGTIWITSLGLGLTLCDGLVATVHLCDPIHAPRSGFGPWTKQQQLLSEVREMPTTSIPSAKRRRRSALRTLIPPLLIVIAVVVWWAVQTFPLPKN